MEWSLPPMKKHLFYNRNPASNANNHYIWIPIYHSKGNVNGRNS